MLLSLAKGAMRIFLLGILEFSLGILDLLLGILEFLLGILDSSLGILEFLSGILEFFKKHGSFVKISFSSKLKLRAKAQSSKLRKIMFLS